MQKLLIVLLISLPAFVNSQSATVQKINQNTPPAASFEPLRFLAADEMMGRAATGPEIKIAARYIAEQFRMAGVKNLSGVNDYFQDVEIRMKFSATSGKMTIGAKDYELGKTLAQFAGKDIETSAGIIYAGNVSEKDIANLDVKGKIVVTELGSPESKGLEAFGAAEQKQKLLIAKGAIALVERYKDYGTPWEGIVGYCMNEHAAYFKAEESELPTFFISDSDSSLKSALSDKSLTASISVKGNKVIVYNGKNVLAYIEGTDPQLKKEFVALSAHYDHIGTDKNPKVADGKLDSIFNGTRDNAIGTTAVINAAKYFSKYPTKRSILLIAYTGEEIGLVGSHYFADHPPLPLKSIIYNLNIDNASYNDTTIVSVIGLGRTSADDHIKKGCAAYGLTAMPDPAPDQNFFDRSDNVSLAAVGIPAPTFSLGIRKFDEEIEKRYHNVTDEVGNFNLNYGLKYMRSFILAAQNIANDPKRPSWIKGDKYEAAWKSLYGK